MKISQIVRAQTKAALNFDYTPPPNESADEKIKRATTMRNKMTKLESEYGKVENLLTDAWNAAKTSFNDYHGNETKFLQGLVSETLLNELQEDERKMEQLAKTRGILVETYKSVYAVRDNFARAKQELSKTIADLRKSG